jgi:methylated-DNA-protein-cysteine methyltransferase related protein
MTSRTRQRALRDAVEPSRRWEEFQTRVYELVQCIPRGRVTTYGLIAAALGDPRKAREVGWALYRTPDLIDIPAQRVVNREGRLSGARYFGPAKRPLNHGDSRQHELLRRERVRFVDADRVDLDAHLWIPDSPAG